MSAEQAPNLDAVAPEGEEEKANLEETSAQTADVKESTEEGEEQQNEGGEGKPVEPQPVVTVGGESALDKELVDLKAKIDLMNQESFKYGQGEVLQEITSARLAEIVHISNDEREAVAKIAEDLKGMDKRLQEVSDALLECNAQIDEAGVVVRDTEDKAAEHEEELAKIRDAVEGDRTQVIKMKERIQLATEEQSVVEKEMSTWRSLVNTWREESGKRQEMAVRVQDQVSKQGAQLDLLKTQLEEDARETKKIAEEMGDLTVSVGAEDEGLDLDLNRLTVKSLDGKTY